MKALSIKQPWAWLIIHGGKDIENRTWKRSFRGRFLIHASKGIDQRAMREYKHLLPPKEDLIGGAIIGSVELVDMVTKSDSPWFLGPVGFVLKDPEPCVPMILKGKLSFFDVDVSSMIWVVKK